MRPNRPGLESYLCHLLVLTAYPHFSDVETKGKGGEDLLQGVFVRIQGHTSQMPVLGEWPPCHGACRREGRAAELAGVRF